MSIITYVDNNSLQLPEYVDDLTINSDEKLNFEVRVCCLFLSPVLIEHFSNEVRLMSLFFLLSTAPRIRGRSEYQQVKIHKIDCFNDSRHITEELLLVCGVCHAEITKDRRR